MIKNQMQQKEIHVHLLSKKSYLGLTFLGKFEFLNVLTNTTLFHRKCILSNYDSQLELRLGLVELAYPEFGLGLG